MRSARPWPLHLRLMLAVAALLLTWAAVFVVHDLYAGWNLWQMLGAVGLGWLEVVVLMVTEPALGGTP